MESLHVLKESKQLKWTISKGNNKALAEGVFLFKVKGNVSEGYGKRHQQIEDSHK